MRDKFDEEEEVAAKSFYDTGAHEASTKAKSAFLYEIVVDVQELKVEILELQKLKEEVLRLREETSRNRQMILSIKKRKDSYGDIIRERTNSMLQLIHDYGGSMTSSSTKSIMGLSKDEFYRTLRHARNNNLIEVLPNPRDRRSYLLKIKQHI